MRVYEYLCCNHTLQLAVRGAFKMKIGQVRVMRVIEHCKSVSKLVKSEARRDELKAACVATNTKFIMPSQPVKTRWNSTEQNLESCVKVRTALLHLSLNDEGDNWSGCVPNGREFIVAEAVQQCLQPCKVATKLWESDKKASLHQVVKQLWVIDSKLTAISTSTQHVKVSVSVGLKIRSKIPDFI